MKKIFFYILLFVIFMNPIFAFGKRVYIDYPDKISVNEVTYKASYNDGFLFHKAYVKAIDTKTSKVLWNKKIYTTLMNPLLEHDVQWVLIKSIVFKKGMLLIDNEKNIQYFLDVKTLKLSK